MIIYFYDQVLLHGPKKKGASSIQAGLNEMKSLFMYFPSALKIKK